MEILSGIVERIIFQNADNGFAVLRIKPNSTEQSEVVTGTSAAIAVGEFVECKGNWINDPTYGRQFQSASIRAVAPVTLEGIEKYLGSGLIKGVGPSLAKRLVEEFKFETLEVLDKDADRLLELPGVGKKKKEQIAKSWKEQREIHNIMAFLQSHGVGTGRAIRIFKQYGNDAVTIVSENPYRLAQDVNGIGFKFADEIARSLGISFTSIFRARAGIKYILKQLSSAGHTAYEINDLVNVANYKLEIPKELLYSAIENEVNEETLFLENIDEKQFVFLASLHRAEVSIAKNLVRLARGIAPWKTIPADESIEQIEKEERISFSESQKEAIRFALQKKFVIITGGPGVGKTKIIQSILQVLKQCDAKPILCAPTGRAAKRLAESTNCEAKTIHRLLEPDGKAFAFKRNSQNLLEGDIAIIDEASMIDTMLLNSLLSAIPTRTSVVIVGDVDQLPSVGPGNVLADMIDSDMFPVVKLNQIFRQEKNSKIVLNAHRINDGQYPIIGERDESLSDFYFVRTKSNEDILQRLKQIVCERIPSRFGLDAVREIQVLTPTNKGPLGSIAINSELQNLFSKEAEIRFSRQGSILRVGDKVIQTENNYDKGIFNGDVGYISQISLLPLEVTVDFDGNKVIYSDTDLDEISLAYAISIHRSQGSEYPAVVIPISTSQFVMLERNLLYTAVTRAKTLVVLIGDPKALEIAVNTARSKERTTALKTFLQRVL